MTSSLGLVDRSRDIAKLLKYYTALIWK